MLSERKHRPREPRADTLRSIVAIDKEHCALLLRPGDDPGFLSPLSEHGIGRYGQAMADLSSISFIDRDSGGAAWIGVRVTGDAVGLATSIEANGDVEVFFGRRELDAIGAEQHDGLSDVWRRRVSRYALAIGRRASPISLLSGRG